jgi:hypothetical protein
LALSKCIRGTHNTSAVFEKVEFINTHSDICTKSNKA